ncbi:MAG: septum formation protein Maf [Akkermansiaceae bacterium]|nr:septum formation protein Maf [Akkermansiaceae bacterium]
MIILASQSPRRRELLSREGVEFRVEVRETDEVHDAALSPETLCSINAGAKAEAVAREFPQDTVIGADTLVFIDGEPLGKPADEAEAVAMLLRLQGRTHCVCTAVAVIMPGGERRDFAEISHVTFRRLDEAAIRHYMGLVHVFDKAGAYAIQEHGELIIERFEGDLDNVIGLPVTRLLEVLAKK